MKRGIFTDKPLIQRLPDGRRILMRHGPIELVIEAMGDEREVERAYQLAARRFLTMLEELVGELVFLRRAITGSQNHLPTGQIASHMHQTASQFYSGQHITPMICVAGAVSDHMLAAMLDGRDLMKAYVNNGGDIALYLAEGQSFDVGVCTNPLTGSIASRAHINAVSGIGGIASSGWRGRSHSLGIADAVTVLACDAATADATATLIANVVDLPGHPAIQRQKASELQPDSDLGERLVTTHVGELAKNEVELALLQGKQLAQRLIGCGDIVAVYGSLQSDEFFASDGTLLKNISRKNPHPQPLFPSTASSSPAGIGEGNKQTILKNNSTKEMIHA